MGVVEDNTPKNRKKYEKLVLDVLAYFLELTIFVIILLNSSSKWQEKSDSKKFYYRFIKNYAVVRSISNTFQEGFEPPTVRLEGECSIRLSYWNK